MKRRAHLRRGRRGASDSVDKTSRAAQWRFVLTFGIVATLLMSLYAFPYSDAGLSERWFESYLRAYARLAGFVLAWFDDAVKVTGNVINGRYSLSIVKTCDAMEANLLFLAAVIAFPAPWYRRLAAAVLGLSILVTVNVFRIGSLYFIGLRWPSRFEFFHAELWPFLLILVSATLFAVWAFWTTRARRNARNGSVEEA